MPRSVLTALCPCHWQAVPGVRKGQLTSVPCARACPTGEDCLCAALQCTVRLQVRAPSEFQGNVIGDLNRRKGLILNSEGEDLDVVLLAQVGCEAALTQYVRAEQALARGLGCTCLRSAPVLQVPGWAALQVPVQPEHHRGCQYRVTAGARHVVSSLSGLCRPDAPCG